MYYYKFLTHEAVAYLGIGAGWARDTDTLLQQCEQALSVSSFVAQRPIRNPLPLEICDRAKVEELADVAHAIIVPLVLPPNDQGLGLEGQRRVIETLEAEYQIALALRERVADSRLYDINVGTAEHVALRHSAVFIPEEDVLAPRYDHSIVQRYAELLSEARKYHGDLEVFDSRKKFDLQTKICARLFGNLPGLAEAVVLLSSTLLDLETEQSILRRAIGLLGQRAATASDVTRFRPEVFNTYPVELPAADSSAAYVENATLYLGLLRSWVSEPPEDSDRYWRSHASRLSYTEQEFKYAVDNGKPRAFFLGDQTQEYPIRQMRALTEKDRQRTLKFVEDIKSDGATLWREFQKPEELETKVFELLGWLTRPSPDQQAYPPPESSEKVYVAHPYLLLDETHTMVRGSQLGELNAWWSCRDETPILTIQALGGMGKSALAWRFFTDLTSSTPEPRQVWWSFYAQGLSA